MTETLYETARYRVDLQETPGAQAVIVSFLQREAARKAGPKDFPRAFVPPEAREKGIPAAFADILVNHNTWYLDPEAVEACRALRRRLPGARLITYGSSMGAYAAINLSAVLEAEQAIALSPLSTIFPPYMTRIDDRRFAEDRAGLDPALDVIGTGGALECRGLLFFDPLHRGDALHAARIASLTRMTLLGVPGGGHPVGRTLRETLPLTTLLDQVVRGTLDLQALRRTLSQIVPVQDDIASLAAHAEALAADPAAVNLADLSHRIMRALADPAVFGAAPKDAIALLTRLAALIRDPGFGEAKAPELRKVTLSQLDLALRRLGAQGPPRT